MKTTKQIFWDLLAIFKNWLRWPAPPPFFTLSGCPDLCNIEVVLCADKQQEVDINNLRLEEEFSAGKARAGGGPGGGAARGAAQGAPLSTISGVKKPLGHTNR